MKKMILICALAAAMTGLSSCTDLSYAEFEDESTGGAPDSTLSAPEPSDTDSAAESEDMQPQEQSSIADTSQTDISSVSGDSSAADSSSSGSDLSEADSSSESSSSEASVSEPDPLELTPQYLAYREIVSEYYERFIDTDSELGGEYCRYYIADLDLDGTKELICETGTFQADRTAYVFTFDGERIIHLGDFITWHAELVETGDRVYSETLAMGSSILYEIIISEGAVTTERAEVMAADVPLRKLACYGYDDLSGLDALLQKPSSQWFNIYN